MGNLSYICSEVKDLLWWWNELKAKADLDFIICEFYNKTLLHLLSCQYDFQGCKHESRPHCCFWEFMWLSLKADSYILIYCTDNSSG